MKRRTLLAAGGGALVALGAGWTLPRPDPKTGLLPGAAMAQSADGEMPEVVDMVLGDPDAPIEVIEYASFTCPHCATFHANQFKAIKENYVDTGKVRIVYREVYFARPGLRASMMARCSGDTEFFFAFSNVLYAEQRAWAASGDPATIIEDLRRLAKTAGLDDVRSYNFAQKSDMPIYAREHVLDQIKREFAYAFAEEKYPGVPRIKTHVIENNHFSLDDLDITPIEVMHHKLPVFGFRIGDFTYITDANHIPGIELEKMKGTRVLVLNALQKTEHISHFTLDEAIEMVAKIQPEQAYFTHISHKLGRHQEVSKELPENVFLAHDGLKIEI